MLCKCCYRNCRAETVIMPKLITHAKLLIGEPAGSEALPSTPGGLGLPVSCGGRGAVGGRRAGSGRSARPCPSSPGARAWL